MYRDSLSDPRTAGNGGFQIVMMLLIVLGGLGFPVLKELGARSRLVVERYRGERSGPLPEMSVHSRLTLWTTGALLLFGALAIYLAEFLVADGAFAHSRFLTAAFASVTARTAGFNTVDTGGIGTTAAVVLLLLMVVGGSPTSTAGGARTTTLAVSVLNMRRILQDRPHLAAFGHRIPDKLAGRAYAIVSLALLWNGVVTWLLTMLHPDQPVLDLAFETVSAFATVGLSRGITPELSAGGKLLIVLTMFAGRVGILTFIYALIPSVPGAKDEDDEVPVLL